MVPAALHPEGGIADAPDAVADHSDDHEDQQPTSVAAVQIFHRTGQVLGPAGADHKQGDHDIEQTPNEKSEPRHPLKLAFIGEVVGHAQDNAAACSCVPVVIRRPNTTLNKAKATRPTPALAAWISQK